MEITNNIKALLDTGASIGTPQMITDGCVPYAVVPDGYRMESIEHTLPIPTRKRGRVTLNDAKSFIAYFKKHNMASSIYGTLNPPRFLAVFDDHERDQAGWREHTAEYQCPLSPEWETWVHNNKRSMKQSDFAQFVEDNLPDIVDPSGADMLEISRSLEAKKKVNFASGIRLSNGQTQLTYEEEIQGTAAKGALQIPEIFSIGIAVLEGGPRYKVEARLRYRIDEGRLAFWYDLVRHHKVLENAVMDVWKEISEQTKQEIFHGDAQA
ncbi:MAG: hypothetical protein B7Y05_02935 [Polynucleobacter sp. 24-46-87]|jgi:uncharacterized protein YfdQ (DUF2303 family)|nr:MAG: hypothetical protein B7Y05_02935 [Polynucleobacter sp. 24-46-87]